jgi:hypothetical protein
VPPSPPRAIAEADASVGSTEVAEAEAIRTAAVEALRSRPFPDDCAWLDVRVIDARSRAPVKVD